MLVLSRKINESIMINDDIKIQILEVRGRQVRVGISAPETVIVHREEIYNKILAEQTAEKTAEQTWIPRSTDKAAG